MHPRTTMIIGIDANGHVGDIRYWTSPATSPDEIERNEEYRPVGPEGAEVENENGCIMREFLEEERMVAVNTWDRQAAGHTWTGGRKAKQRVDYILIDIDKFTTDVKSYRGVREQKNLRARAGLYVTDHIPVGVSMKIAPWTLKHK